MLFFLTESCTSLKNIWDNSPAFCGICCPTLVTLRSENLFLLRNLYNHPLDALNVGLLHSSFAFILISSYCTGRCLARSSLIHCASSLSTWGYWAFLPLELEPWEPTLLLRMSPLPFLAIPKRRCSCFFHVWTYNNMTCINKLNFPLLKWLCSMLA